MHINTIPTEKYVWLNSLESEPFKMYQFFLIIICHLIRANGTHKHIYALHVYLSV